MMYDVGLGLGNAKAITVRVVKIVKRCENVYLEHYTSLLQELEAAYGQTVELADKDLVQFQQKPAPKMLRHLGHQEGLLKLLLHDGGGQGSGQPAGQPLPPAAPS